MVQECRKLEQGFRELAEESSIISPVMIVNESSRLMKVVDRPKWIRIRRPDPKGIGMD